jgi:hypothetical protein
MTNAPRRAPVHPDADLGGYLLEALEPLFEGGIDRHGAVISNVLASVEQKPARITGRKLAARCDEAFDVVERIGITP